MILRAFQRRWKGRGGSSSDTLAFRVRLPVKLSLLLAGASTFPLLLATAFTLPTGREALRGQLDRIYAQDAHSLAEAVHRNVVERLDALTLAASNLHFGAFDPVEREQALLLIYKQTRGADVVGLFDARGDAVGPEIHFARLEGELSRTHEVANAEGLAVYARSVPLQGALQAGLAIGPVYTLPDVKGDLVPRLVLGVGVPGRGKDRWVLAVEISLRGLSQTFEAFRPGEQSTAFLLDGHENVIVPPHTGAGLRFTQLRDHPIVKGTPTDAWVGASALVPLLGWKAVVVEPADEALRPLRHLQTSAIAFLFLGLLAAVGIGVTSVRTVTLPIQKLRDAAWAITSGALETQVDVRGKDELAELAAAFNQMTRGLREREALRVTLSLSETLELEEVLDRLLDSLGRALRFDNAAALIRERTGVVVVTVRGKQGKEEARRILPTAPHVVRAIASHKPALNEGRQMLAVPLLRRQEVIGVMSLESRTPYDDTTVALAASVVQPAAMAVENARLFEEVQELATLDGLTGTNNRRYFMELAQLQFDSARRFGQPLSALMLDVDHFKSVNDRYGHAVGDQVLRVVAERCKTVLRSIDLLGRYGGEEFAIMLPGTIPRNAAAILGERLREKIGGEPIPTDAGNVQVTISIGVAGLDAGTQDPGMLLKRADGALYEAKQRGRNRVIEASFAAQKPAV